MPASQPLNVTAFIDRQPLSAFQVSIVVLCFLIVAVDGFDTAAIGFIAPAIRAEWQLTPAQLAPLFGAGLGGLMVGAFLFGPLADRFGRKGVLVLSVLFFGAASLASAWSPDLWTLVLLRFLTGLGLGGAMPNAITLTSEFCPDKRRSFLVTTMFCGFTLGSAVGGLASAGLIDAFGWRSVLVAGGVMPLGLAALLLWLLPESVRYLVLAGKQRERIVATLQKIAPQADLRDATFVVGEQRSTSSPVRHLFRPELLRGTLLFWLTFFMSLLVIYLLSSWLPTLLRTTGHSLRTAALVTTMFQVGGTVGAIALGWLMDRINPHYVLASSYALAALGIAAVGSFASEPVAAGMAVFLAGFCISGSQVGANALSASFYPTDCRATGVSWANGVGRMGSVVGSVGGATMLSMGLGMPALFALIGVPALIAGLSMFSLGMVRRERAVERLAV
ncbi:aromatic acid/H+ symport family MFS transporter [Cupriavidus sp. UYPR2.512]|uniref:MFS transporter n=1 Tax=Cupriavidus sp. UYPR2.512 TaxID=1080187 RepID=UPI000365D0AC|nr:aromatic acid/H+ symport family MFS transporter [Cupriavidus sp. UYPR2.512]UIF90198.1 aromatic acid/H+ symport family MFS transporter [Cupriavidus necator]